MTEAIHVALQKKDLLPHKHMLDTEYLDAELRLTSQQQDGVELVGPTRLAYHWQARNGQGFATTNFSVN